jgi:hypothetical protein
MASLDRLRHKGFGAAPNLLRHNNYRASQEQLIRHLEHVISVGAQRLSSLALPLSP